MAMPKISIITPTFDSDKTIEKCLQSVQELSYHFVEHILIDNLSSDDTLKIINNFVSTNPSNKIKLISEGDNGIYDAMNKGIINSSGDYLLFLGSDDCLFSNDVIEKVFSLKGVDGYDFIYGNSLFVPSNYVYEGKFNKLKLYKKNISHQSIFYKRSLFDKFGLYDIRFRTLSDWVFNMKCFNSNIKIKYLDMIVSNYFIYGATSRAEDKLFTEMIEELRKQYFPRHINFLGDYFHHFFKRQFVKYIYNPLSMFMNI